MTAPRTSGRRKEVTACVVSDTHSPFTDARALKWACERIRDVKPDYIIHLGDLFEADAASRFPNEYDHDLLDEYKHGAGVLTNLEQSAPRAERWWLLGNHCDNIQSKGRIDPRTRNAVHWSGSRYAAVFDRWRQFPYEYSPRGSVRLGQVIFKHGFDGPADRQALDFAGFHGWHAHTLVVSGHTHRAHSPERVKRGRTFLPFWHANVGTLGPLKPEWTKRQNTSDWTHAMAVIRIGMGRASQNGVNWKCEVVTR